MSCVRKVWLCSTIILLDMQARHKLIEKIICFREAISDWLLRGPLLIWHGFHRVYLGTSCAYICHLDSTHTSVHFSSRSLFILLNHIALYLTSFKCRYCIESLEFILPVTLFVLLLWKGEFVKNYNKSTSLILILCQSCFSRVDGLTFYFHFCHLLSKLLLVLKSYWYFLQIYLLIFIILISWD